MRRSSSDVETAGKPSSQKKKSQVPFLRAHATKAGLEANQATRSCAIRFQPKLAGSLSAGLAACLKTFQNRFPTPAMETLNVDAMPLVIELCVLLLLFPPPSKVTWRGHLEQKGALLKSCVVTRNTMFDLEDSPHAGPSRIVSPTPDQLDARVSSAHRWSVSGFVSYLSWHRTSEQFSRVLPLSRSNFQLATTNC